MVIKLVLPTILSILFLITILSLSQPILSAQPFASEPPVNQPSPQNHIAQNQISVYNDRFIIETSDEIFWTKITDTKSMDPTFDSTAHVVLKKVSNPAQVQVGDIITFTTPKGLIIHRIIAIGYDQDGWFATTQGDNLAHPDPYPVRSDQITGVVIAILY
ncbi:MAG: signal peptidase I [Candidatus Woesearchaeota archaeon]